MIKMQREEKKKILNKYLLQETKICRYRQMADLYPERRSEFLKRADCCNRLRLHIEESIAQIEDDILSELLFQKYVFGKTLEEIAFNMNYSKRHIERLHITALEKLEI